jgi:hypothetical protein
LFNFLKQQEPSGDATRLEHAVEQFTSRQTRRGLVVLLSDMFDAGDFHIAIDSLRLQGYEPLLIHVLDGSELSPAVSGKVTLEAVEGNSRRREFIDAQDLAYFRAAFEDQCRRVRGYFHRYGLGVVPVMSDDSVTRCLERIVLGSVHRRHTRAGVR